MRFDRIERMILGWTENPKLWQKGVMMLIMFVGFVIQPIFFPFIPFPHASLMAAWQSLWNK
jgi:hypothetical protein